MRILIVEDDKKIASFIVKGLTQAGFAVDHASDGEDGLERALTAPYDAAVVDIMLPKMDGLALIAALRAKDKNIPVIILSAKHSVDDRVKGLQTGGDDYLTKPFAFSELLARIQALLRRTDQRDHSAATSLHFQGIILNLITREVTRDGKKIELRPREFALLEYLLRNAGNVVSKTLIMEHVWNYDFDPQTNVVDVLVCRLREKVDTGFSKKLIHTLRGLGYALKTT